jgi:uncharacterized LabA/DUF88 family protein
VLNVGPGSILKRIAVFADVQNIYYTTRDKYDRQFNYRECWRRISQDGDVVLANAYAIHRGDDKQIKFQEALRHIGFNVRLKQFIQRSDGSAKGDWDVGITIDVMEAADKVDCVVLLTGDGDFGILVTKLRNDFDTEVVVYGVPGLTAGNLIESASTYHPITEDLLQ